MKKTLKEFMEENQITSFDLVGDLIVNVVVDETPYALDTDTSNIPGGTPLESISEFTIVDDILSIKNINVDINNIYLI